MEKRITYLVLIVPPLPIEQVRQFLESLEQLQNSKKGGDHEPAYASRN